MNRWTIDEDPTSKRQILSKETRIISQEGVRIDDGERKTKFVDGELTLTSHRLLWFNPSAVSGHLSLHLSLIVLVEEESSRTFKGSEKIILYLAPPNPGATRTSVSSSSDQNFVRLAFKIGGQRTFREKLTETVTKKLWNVKVATSRPVIRSGIAGIEKSIQQRSKATNSEISKAFQDLDKLIERAKPMVSLANNLSRRIKEKQGEISDDETVKFKSYLMSLGISDPVTRETHGQNYYTQLAKEIFKILDKPIQEQGGMITLSDAYCRVNRARGLELISPEDLLNACTTFQQIPGIPLCLHTFEATGVSVIQMVSIDLCNPAILNATEDAVIAASCLTAEEFSRQAGLAVALAKERLLAAERCGRICRDDSVEGVKFYPNLFLTTES